MPTYTIPFTPLPVNGLRKEIDRLFDDVFMSDNGRGSSKPAVEVRETRGGFTFEYDVPGISPDSIEVITEDGMLIVRGERASRELADGERRLVGERFAGRFERAFRMPKTADASSIAASYTNGVLTVRIEKVTPAQPRRIAISMDDARAVTNEKSQV